MFKKCLRCGKLTRDVDPKCWNCEATNFAAERVQGDPGHPIDSSAKALGTPVHCPKCGSTQVTADKKGFGWGKALAGGVLTGGVGLLAGFVGSRKIIVTCITCGNQWQAGRQLRS